MTWPLFAAIVASVSFNAFAQVALRGAMGGLSSDGPGGILALAQRIVLTPLLWLGLLLFAASILVWLFVLAKVPVSIAYPMSSLGYVIATIAAVAILGETLDLRKVVGLSLIVAGVVCLSSTRTIVPHG
jgi:multidrug transporter EmrE-like cation transporter